MYKIQSIIWTKYFALFCLAFFFCKQERNILIYIGAASKPPMEEILAIFEEETKIKTKPIFGGSGYILSQLKLSKKGDIFFPGSSDYMELAKRENLILEKTEKRVVYLVPTLNVQAGNPKNIQTLYDLLRPNLRIAIANPESVCIGLYAVEIIEKNFSNLQKETFKKNLLTFSESCEKTASLLVFKTVDAVIGWHVFQNWNPESILTIPLKAREIQRIGYIPISVLKFSTQPEIAQKLIEFIINNPKSKAIFKKYGYFLTQEEAEKFVGEKKEIGGEYTLPSNWSKK